MQLMSFIHWYLLPSRIPAEKAACPPATLMSPREQVGSAYVSDIHPTHTHAHAIASSSLPSGCRSSEQSKGPWLCWCRPGAPWPVIC
jgi:hypothetical protein